MLLMKLFSSLWDQRISVLSKLAQAELIVLTLSKYKFEKIDNNKITGSGVRQLLCGEIANPIDYFISLKSLSLAMNKIGNKGIKWLVKANLPHLQTLIISLLCL